MSFKKASPLLGALLLIFPSCSSGKSLTSTDFPVTATPSCLNAFSEASKAMTQLYATHPMFQSEYDDLLASGDEGLEMWDEIATDASDAYDAIVDPVYDACNGVEDLFAGAYAHRDSADWSLGSTGFGTFDEQKSMFLSVMCYRNEQRPACNDFDPDDWHF